MSLIFEQPTSSESVRSTAGLNSSSPHRATAHQCWAKALVASLDPPEFTLLLQIVAGWSRSESAAYMTLELHQFDEQRLRLFEKIHAISTADAVRIGIYAGLD